MALSIPSHRLWRFFFFLLVIPFVYAAGAQTDSTSPFTHPIPIHSSEYAQNVDYHSFYPLLMLKHRIGEFSKLPKNPVLSRSQAGWDRKDVSDPFVLVSADSIYLFYGGSGGGRYSLGYAVRDPEGWFWMKRSKILPQPNGEWDSYHQIDPHVVRVGDEWRLYYSGNSSDSELGYQIGAAIKNSDGKWVYPQKSPVMPVDSTAWDFAGSIYADVHYFSESGNYKMWYTGFQGPLSAIGLAESKDGYRWQKIGDAPVFNLFPGVIAPAVIFNGEKYVMYFARLTLASGFNTKISRAESEDGIHWDNVQDVLHPTERWEGSRLMSPNLSFFEQRVHLFYCAQKGGNWQIGAAVADAVFQPKGIWRSAVIKQKVRRLEIKFEQPEGTSIKLSIIELASGKRIPFSILDEARLLRKNVYASRLSGLEVRGGWQIEVELETTSENHSPVIYEISWE